MPHKRAKRPVGEQEKAKLPASSVPKISIEQEPIPKSVSRVLNAEHIRREYRKKRQLESVGGSDGSDVGRKKRRHEANTVEKTALRIKPGETIPQFDRRVESTMMPLVKSALRQSSAQERKVRKEENRQEILKRGRHGQNGHHPLEEGSKKGPDPPTTAGNVNPRDATKEFDVVSTSAPRRLNDIAQEPPVIRKLPRGATKRDAAPSGVLSIAQKVMMEEEREKVIKRYRELKARKLRESDGGKHQGCFGV